MQKRVSLRKLIASHSVSNQLMLMSKCSETQIITRLLNILLKTEKKFTWLF